MKYFRKIGRIVLILLLNSCGWTAITKEENTIPPTPSLPLPQRALPQLVTPSSDTLTGRVVDLEGNPIAGAILQTESARGESDTAGRFNLPGQAHPRWITVTHPGYISRTRAIAPQHPIFIRLTPTKGDVVSILFGGDVMFGRRFFDPNEDGDFSDGFLPPQPTVEDHLALLKDLKPFLENADLTFVNYETSLSWEPGMDYTQARSSDYHPSKDYVYSSHPNSVRALKEVGVDILGLGNNHIYDRLDLGVKETLEELARAGFPPQRGYFGAGLDSTEAWRPAVLDLKGQSIAFLGCTTITGVEHELIYVATSDKAGAANCTESELVRAVSQASAHYDVVIMMIHGGYEYSRVPSPHIEKLASLAKGAGAKLVIIHHTHTIGGLDWDGRNLTAWSLGNFIFDQTIWPTFETMALIVNLRKGEIISVYAEPLFIDQYVAGGVTGKLADTVSREIAGYSSQSFILGDGMVELNTAVKTTSNVVNKEFDGGEQPGTIYSLNVGEWISGFKGAGNLRLGRDILYVGSFEDLDVDSKLFENPLWTLNPPYKDAAPQYAFEGNGGGHLQRGAQNIEPVYLSPEHRLLVNTGSQLTVMGDFRASPNAIIDLQVGWYSDTEGHSQKTDMYHLTVNAAHEWQPFRVDLIVPNGIVAVDPFIRMPPPFQGNASADFDNLLLIEWTPPDAGFSPLYNYYWLTGTGTITVQKEYLPGDSPVP